jgi:hypothetical protein
VDQSDGLNETELDALTARSMARVEYLREVEFERDAPVEVVSTETYRERYDLGAGGSELTAQLKNARYEALLLVGEDSSDDTPNGSIPTDGFEVLPVAITLVALGGLLHRRS